MFGWSTAEHSRFNVCNNTEKAPDNFDINSITLGGKNCWRNCQKSHWRSVLCRQNLLLLLSSFTFITFSKQFLYTKNNILISFLFFSFFFFCAVGLLRTLLRCLRWWSLHLNSEIHPDILSYSVHTSQISQRTSVTETKNLPLHMEENGWCLYWKRWVNCKVRTEHFC